MFKNSKALSELWHVLHKCLWTIWQYRLWSFEVRNVNYKKCAPKFVFINEKKSERFRSNRVYFSFTRATLWFISGFYSFIRCQLVFNWFSALRTSCQDLDVYYERAGKFEFQKFNLNKSRLNLKLNLRYEFEFAFKLEKILKYFFKKCLGSPCYNSTH